MANKFKNKLSFHIPNQKSTILAPNNLSILNQNKDSSLNKSINSFANSTKSFIQSLLNKQKSEKKEENVENTLNNIDADSLFENFDKIIAISTCNIDDLQYQQQMETFRHITKDLNKKFETINVFKAQLENTKQKTHDNNCNCLNCKIGQITTQNKKKKSEIINNNLINLGSKINYIQNKEKPDLNKSQIEKKIPKNSFYKRFDDYSNDPILNIKPKEKPNYLNKIATRKERYSQYQPSKDNFNMTMIENKENFDKSNILKKELKNVNKDKKYTIIHRRVETHYDGPPLSKDEVSCCYEKKKNNNSFQISPFGINQKIDTSFYKSHNENIFSKVDQLQFLDSDNFSINTDTNEKKYKKDNYKENVGKLLKVLKNDADKRITSRRNVVSKGENILNKSRKEADVKKQDVIKRSISTGFARKLI